MQRKILGLLLLASLLVPVAALAHTGESFTTDLDSEADYALMVKMMSGQELEDQEWEQMRSFMEEHHQDGGMMGMMMGGIGTAQDMPAGGGWMGPGANMMAGAYQGPATFWTWLVRVNLLAWLLVAILASTWLIRKLSER